MTVRLQLASLSPQAAPSFSSLAVTQDFTVRVLGPAAARFCIAACIFSRCSGGIESRTDCGIIIPLVAVVEVTDTLQAGHASLPNGFGLDHEGHVHGIAPNELTSSSDRDWIADLAFQGHNVGH